MIIKIKCDMDSGEADVSKGSMNDLDELIAANPLLAADVLKDAVFFLNLWYQEAHARAFGYDLPEIDRSKLQ